MSSLLQHHGCTTTPQRGRVELLMYLTKWVEEPMKCMNCGREVFFPLQREHFCECGQLIGDVFHYTESEGRKCPSDSTNWRMWEHWSEELNERCRSGKYQYTYAANRWKEVDAEEAVRFERDGKVSLVPPLYRIFRKPVGMFGCWVTFRYNGDVHAPDLSVPIRVEKLPRDAVRLTDEEAARYWFTP